MSEEFREKCRIRARRERVPKIEFPCERDGCHNKIFRTAAMAKYRKHHFCSLNCRIASTRGKLKVFPPKICDVCKREFNRLPNEEASKFQLRKMCSELCLEKYKHEIFPVIISRKLTGINRKGNPNYKISKMGEKNPQYGKIPWNFGIPCSQETVSKIREARLFQEIQQDTKPEKLLHAELEKRGIEFQKNIYIDGRPDIFILPDVCIFVDGDYHHANPSKYKPNDRILGSKIAKDIQKHDNEVTNWLSEMGFKVFRFWSSEIAKDPASCIDKVLKSL